MTTFNCVKRSQVIVKVWKQGKFWWTFLVDNFIVRCWWKTIFWWNFFRGNYIFDILELPFQKYSIIYWVFNFFTFLWSFNKEWHGHAAFAILAMFLNVYALRTLHHFVFWMIYFYINLIHMNDWNKMKWNLLGDVYNFQQATYLFSVFIQRESLQIK